MRMPQKCLCLLWHWPCRSQRSRAFEQTLEYPLRSTKTKYWRRRSCLWGLLCWRREWLEEVDRRLKLFRQLPVSTKLRPLLIIHSRCLPPLLLLKLPYKNFDSNPCSSSPCLRGPKLLVWLHFRSFKGFYTRSRGQLYTCSPFQRSR